MTEPTEDLNIDIKLTERTEGTLSLRPVGHNAYVLIEIIDVTDDGLELAIEVGGGAKARPVDELATFIEIIGEALGGYTEAPDEDAATEDD